MGESNIRTPNSIKTSTIREEVHTSIVLMQNFSSSLLSSVHYLEQKNYHKEAAELNYVIDQ